MAAESGKSFIGAARLDPYNRSAHGDVAAYEDLAFVGKYQAGCPATGVDIIDISDPARPAKIADTADHRGTSMEDMQAMRIGARDVLATGLQTCGGAAEGVDGLELVDITNPREPETLSVYETRQGVHELDITSTPTKRALALLAVPGLEISTAKRAGAGGEGDLLIIDITDPAKPVRLAEWGLLDEPRLGPSAYLGARRGGHPDVLLHSVRANADGTRAYLSYWDAGVITLDIQDPRKPRYIGRTAFGSVDDGNAHSVVEIPERKLLVQADEDFSPYETSVTGTALSSKRLVFDVNFVTPVTRVPGKAVEGRVVRAGRGCAAKHGQALRGALVLVEDGECNLDQKAAVAQQRGAVGAIVYPAADQRENPVPIQVPRRIRLPDGEVTAGGIPVVYVDRETGLALSRGGTTASARVAATFNGWGYLRIFDFRDPARPVQLGTFATPNTRNEAVADRGRWSVHNPEVRAGVLYASWYSDGVRALDISDPAKPRESAAWTGQGRPVGAPPIQIWSVVPHNGLLLASDFNYGLYVLRHEP
jgi:hypothetical protein